METSICLQSFSFHGQVSCKINLKLLKERLWFPHKELKLNNTVRQLFSIRNFVVILFYFCSFFNSFIVLWNRKFREFLKRFFYVLPIWTWKHFKLWWVDDEVKFCETSQESFQVVASLLDEDQIFISKVFLWWNCWDRYAGPSFC